jgi:hypothetical protein
MGADWMGADFQSGPTGAIQSDGSRGASLPMK